MALSEQKPINFNNIIIRKGLTTMTKLTLNNTEFTINGYNRYTNIDDDGVRSSANVSFPDNTQYNALVAVGPISSVSIAIDGTTVYSMQNISAKIASISENLYEGGMTMSAQIAFLEADEEE